jgi:hypothetical protein
MVNTIEAGCKRQVDSFVGCWLPLLAGEERDDRTAGRGDTGQALLVDILSDIPSEQGHGTFYYEGILRPHLVVIWGPDGKVRKVSY